MTKYLGTDSGITPTTEHTGHLQGRLLQALTQDLKFVQFIHCFLMTHAYRQVLSFDVGGGVVWGVLSIAL